MCCRAKQGRPIKVTRGADYTQVRHDLCVCVWLSTHLKAGKFAWEVLNVWVNLIRSNSIKRNLDRTIDLTVKTKKKQSGTINTQAEWSHMSTLKSFFLEGCDGKSCKTSVNLMKSVALLRSVQCNWTVWSRVDPKLGVNGSKTCHREFKCWMEWMFLIVPERLFGLQTVVNTTNTE